MTQDLRYPIGKPLRPEGPFSASQREALIDGIADLPRALRAVVEKLNKSQLDTPYRPDGWTVRQVVHHIADSHMNAYVRTRLALTEDTPVIRPYDEGEWAKLSDARDGDPKVSLVLLDALHSRWATLLRSLPPESFAREFKHPEAGTMSIDAQIGLYDWHGRHHIAHITELAKREGW